jgi:hypothetical protein
MSEEKIDARAQANIKEPASDGPEGRRVTRENRKPFGSQTQKLAFKKREGYFHYWFNDTPGRIDAAKEAGYTHVLDKVTQKPVQMVVGVTAQGGALNGFLMEIPEEWHDADMAENERKVAEKEDTIRRGQVEAADPRERDSRFTNTAQGRKIDIRNTVTRR